MSEIKPVWLLLVDPIRKTAEHVVADSSPESIDARCGTGEETRPWVRNEVGTRALRAVTPINQQWYVVYEPKRNLAQRKLVEIEVWWPWSKWGRQWDVVQKAWDELRHLERVERLRRAFR